MGVWHTADNCACAGVGRRREARSHLALPHSAGSSLRAVVAIAPLQAVPCYDLLQSLHNLWIPQACQSAAQDT